MTFQQIILTLQKFWSARGCILEQPYDVEKGAGTMNPATFLRTIGPEPWNVAYVEPSRRPDDGRYGDNPNRLYQHHQFQVIMKPSPDDIQEIYLESLRELGIVISALSRITGSLPRSAPGGSAGKCGWTVWKSRSSLISSRLAVSMHILCPWKSLTVWSVSPCTYRKRIMSMTWYGRTA